MAEPDAAAAADLATNVAAQHEVVLAAREVQAAVRALAALSANAGKGSDTTRVRCELEKKIVQLTEKFKGAVDAVGPGGRAPLLAACAQGRVDDLAALLALGADPGKEGDVSSISDPDKKYKYTSLLLAARDGRMKIVRVLLAHERVDVNQASSDAGVTALCQTCVSGHDAVVTPLLAHVGIDANKAAGNGATPLFVACHKGDAEIVMLLLAHVGIDVNKATNNGTTPLFVACHKGHVEVVTLMLAHGGIDMNKAASDGGATPLWMACSRGHADIVTLLWAHGGVAVNKAADNDSTPLFIACLKGHVEIVKLLLAHSGIDVNKATNNGTTPLNMACQEGLVGIAKLLLPHDGIDLNKATDKGTPPLYFACQEGHVEIVTLLLALDGIDANKAASHGATPLYIACQQGHIAIIKLLLAHSNIDVNKATTDTGETPLHGAIIGNALLAMRYLVVHGARLRAADTNGVTPAQLATRQTKHELAEWLNAVSGWSQLRVAAGCRLYKDAAFLLRRGKIDPDDTATRAVEDIMAVVATSHVKPAALPWENAPPVCRATIKLVADATRGWHRTTHWLHHKAVRHAVVAVLVVIERLQKKGLVLAETASDAGAAADSAVVTAQVPLIPIEIWLFAMRFFQRSWWAVEGA